MLITAMLEQLNITPELVENGQMAVAKCQEEDFDIILMDCQMPVMDGLTATRLIRALDKPQPFIVALTANAMAEDKEACFEAGMDEFVTKPVQKEELKLTLQKFLQAN